MCRPLTVFTGPGHRLREGHDFSANTVDLGAIVKAALATGASNNVTARREVSIRSNGVSGLTRNAADTFVAMGMVFALSL
jgi:F0F1-type ATP synthase beta subunit